ncbi:DsbC family protein [Kingella kingae]|uniref:DsbC family protein n=1 Tax=Kingella kingae TaxID=504 RepID=UPI0003FD64AC|nr:DsbC family protein [Kingella kingae]MDK4534234.1 DsbC family protein [Kingella kingae]MDK4540722.1 DsbC family protein [Kingella kingae]MDK4553183.1 DsbC family protein [Kingella kingae]
MKHTIWTTSILTMAILSACGQAPAANGQAKAPAPAATAAKQPAQVAKDVPADVAKTITQTLESRYADRGLKITAVNSTPVAGLYEIVAGGNQIAYTDVTGQHMLVGDLIATADGRSLTEERKAELSAIDFNSLPLDLAIKEVRGNGELKVAVFSDADCPFCKRLEREFTKMNNVTIYNFMMPLESLHPDAARKTVQILCQPNPTQAWTEWMREGKMPPKVAECETTMAKTLALGEQFGFNGTPTIVYPNGKTQSGALTMPHLEQAIKANQI